MSPGRLLLRDMFRLAFVVASAKVPRVAPRETRKSYYIKGFLTGQSDPDEHLGPRKELSKWRVISTHPSGHEPVFINDEIGYESWFPPRGYTLEEVMRFRGADEADLSVETLEGLIEERDGGRRSVLVKEQEKN